MGEVQYLRPEPFRYNPLQGPVKGGLADEEPISVDVETQVRVSHGLGGLPTEGVLGLFPKELLHRHGRDVAFLGCNRERVLGFPRIDWGLSVISTLAGVLLLPLPLYRETRDLVVNRFGAGTLNSEA